MAEPNRHDIRMQLWNELNQAQVQYASATSRFDFLVQECPAGIPHPDGSLRIQQAGRDSRAALQHYLIALKRFTDITLNGSIPENLRLPAQPEHTAIE